MDIKMWFTVIVTFSMISFITALKEGECEGNLFLYIAFLLSNNILSLVTYLFLSFFIVCVTTVNKFVESLTNDIKDDPKKIETEFKEFCKTTKSKENRFVSTSTIQIIFI